MRREIWSRVDRLFDACADATDAERESLLAKELERGDGESAAVVAEVRSLLESDERIGDFIEHPAFEAASPEALHPSDESIVGADLGPWRVLEEIGRGGMGAVYLARRADGHFEQDVAIKVVKRGMDTDEIVRRFQAERRLLARLVHPGIARLYDGGVTPDGRPWLAMEYVSGRPLDQFVREENLSISGRLKLFRRICEAVQFAHRNLVIHRDLKPGNILVTKDGEPKLLDFGVARIVRDDDGQGQTVTGGSLRLLTPEYASPEQVLGEPVTTASDVFSLGVILFELLTGRRPFDAESRRVEAAGRGGLDASPDRPSTAIRTSDEFTAERGRRTARLLRGDLDNIALMALRREPDRRYASAEQFSEDVRRHLEGLPVMARTDTLAYRSSKFIRRHTVGVVAAAVLVVLLAGGVVAGGYLAWRATEAEDQARAEAGRADQVREFLTGMLESADPSIALGEEITVRMVLDDASEMIDGEFADQPDIRAELHQTVGRTYLALGLLDRAWRHLQLALAGLIDVYGSEHDRVADALLWSGDAHYKLARFDEAYADFAESERISRLSGERETRDIVHAMRGRGRVLREQGKYDEAISVLEEAKGVGRTVDDRGFRLESWIALLQGRLFKGDLEGAALMYREIIEEVRATEGQDATELLSIVEELEAIDPSAQEGERMIETWRLVFRLHEGIFGPDDPATLASMNNYGRVLMTYAADVEETGRLISDAVERHRRVLGPRHPSTMTLMANQALWIEQAGRLAEAEMLGRRVLKARRSMLPADHRHIAESANNLASVLHTVGRRDEARELYEEALRIYRDGFGNSHPNVLASRNNLAHIMSEEGQFEQAAAIYRDVLAALRAQLDESHPNVLLCLNNLASALHKSGRIDESIEAYSELMPRLKGVFPPGHMHVIAIMSNYAGVLADAGRMEEARDVYSEAVSLAREHLPPDHHYIAIFSGRYAKVLIALEAYEDAEALLLDAFRIMRGTFADDSEQVGSVELALVDLYEAWGRPDEAEPYRAGAARHAASLRVEDDNE